MPNIEGKTSAPVGNSGSRPLVTNSDSQLAAGAFETLRNSDSKLNTYTAYDSSLYFNGDKFDASKGEVHNGSYSNLVYGKSDTVQPQAIKQYVYIVLANAYRLPVTINIDNVMTDINTIHDQITDINSDITDLSNAISSISSHFDVGNAVFNSTSSTGLQTKQVNFNKTFSQIPTVIVCWAEPTAQNISAYCAHLQVASG